MMRGMIWLLAVAGGLMVTFFQGFGVGASMEIGQAYRLDLPLNSLNLATLQGQAQALGWSVRVQDDTEVGYFLGNDPCTACETAMESLFFNLPQLVVDGSAFMMRLETEAFRLNVRPVVDAVATYELVLVMRQTLEADVVRDQVNQELSQFGLSVNESLEFELIPLSSKAKAAVPAGVRLEETLFRLTQAPDWPDFASLQGIDLSGLRVQVVVALTNGSVEPSGFDLVVEARASESMRAQVLIPELLALGRDAAVANISVPLQAQPGQ